MREFSIGRGQINRQASKLGDGGGARLGLEDFQRDLDFDLQAFARRSFGTFQETPVKVVLRFNARAAPDAATLLFHPDQTVNKNNDGTVTVRFEAGGLDEMCWHLVTRGDSVTVERPAKLRQRLAAMCDALAAYHGSE
ncbi:MAG: WYL domain-containing protein [Alphaproteobacteria bacterium]|nr:WYL domain-containing protein [Alphaproteobacteria bacterium]